MKKICTRLLFFAGIGLLAMLTTTDLYAQCNKPYIKIDGTRVLADNSQSQNGLALPFWLKEGQTLAADQNVLSISVLEFTVTGTTLEFSQVRSVTSSLAVPSGKVWKVESVIKNIIYNSNNSSLVVSGNGTFNWTVPSCVTYACIEIWGAGGGGGGSNSTPAAGGGGGGGGYGYQCFTVTPGSSHMITVGSGGIGGAAGASGTSGSSSSVGALISASGGAFGTHGNGGGAGGAGGTSSATLNVTGGTGGNGVSGSNPSKGGSGGISANGGSGGAGGVDVGPAGVSPGGGGAGGGYNGSVKTGGSGADGKVVITW
jgi:hypothetical protein